MSFCLLSTCSVYGWMTMTAYVPLWINGCASAPQNKRKLEELISEMKSLCCQISRAAPRVEVWNATALVEPWMWRLGYTCLSMLRACSSSQSFRASLIQRLLASCFLAYVLRIWPCQDRQRSGTKQKHTFRRTQMTCHWWIFSQSTDGFCTATKDTMKIKLFDRNSSVFIVR